MKLRKYTLLNRVQLDRVRVDLQGDNPSIYRPLSDDRCLRLISIAMRLNMNSPSSRADHLDRVAKVHVAVDRHTYYWAHLQAASAWLYCYYYSYYSGCCCCCLFGSLVTFAICGYQALQVQGKKAVSWPAPFFFLIFCRSSFDGDVGQFAAK